MSDTNVLGTILGIGLAGALLFAFPLMTIADRNDDIAQQAVQKKTVEFVDKERNIGAITQSDLDEYKEELGSLGHTFNIHDYSAYHNLVDFAVEVRKQPVFQDYGDISEYPYFKPRPVSPPLSKRLRRLDSLESTQ